MPVSEWLSRRDLRLRAMPRVIVGYVVAPLAGLTAFWLAESAYLVVIDRELSTAFYSLIPIVALGIGPAMIGEALIATPILLLLRLFRRTWPSAWVMSVVGIATGEVPLLIATVWDGVATGFV